MICLLRDFYCTCVLPWILKLFSLKKCVSAISVMCILYAIRKASGLFLPLMSQFEFQEANLKPFIVDVIALIVYTKLLVFRRLVG